jgi:nucleoid-associated protein YgaU
MIQRDWKIGLVVGLILVIIVVIKFATDPSLSPEARMMQGNKASESREDANSTDIFAANKTDEQKDVSNMFSLDTELSTPSVSESQTNKISNGVVFNDHASLDDLQVASNISDESLPVALNIDRKETPEEPQNNLGNNISNSQLEQVPFNYESAEPIKTERFYIVGKNQTLSDISRIFYGSANQWQKIVDANPELAKDPNKIKVGMKLIIPKIAK